MNHIPSPDNSDAGIERAIVEAGADKHPRVTPADIEANIAAVEIVTHISVSGQVLRWAVITTQSGYSAAGRPSVSASSANDNEAIGVRVATENTRNELWPLMGYELKQRLHNAA
jgi:hypothetical protein